MDVSDVWMEKKNKQIIIDKLVVLKQTWNKNWKAFQNANKSFLYTSAILFGLSINFYFPHFFLFWFFWLLIPFFFLASFMQGYICQHIRWTWQKGKQTLVTTGQEIQILQK